jgi:hypothetical protein
MRPLKTAALTEYAVAESAVTNRAIDHGRQDQQQALAQRTSVHAGTAPSVVHDAETQRRHAEPAARGRGIKSEDVESMMQGADRRVAIMARSPRSARTPMASSMTTRRIRSGRSWPEGTPMNDGSTERLPSGVHALAPGGMFVDEIRCQASARAFHDQNVPIIPARGATRSPV